MGAEVILLVSVGVLSLWHEVAKVPAEGRALVPLQVGGVITSYSIHYTKLYEIPEEVLEFSTCHMKKL